MSEATARALGAKSSEPIMIAGKECVPRGLGLRELSEVEASCLRSYKRRYLETYSENLDLLPDSDRTRILQEEIRRTAGWDVEDLPCKYGFNAEEIALTPELKKCVMGYVGIAEDSPDTKFKRLVAGMLDEGTLSEEKYLELSHTTHSPKYKIPYAAWWITGCVEGKVTLLWACFRDNGVTREEVEKEFSDNPGLLFQISQEIERLSAPKAGNG